RRCLTRCRLDLADKRLERAGDDELARDHRGGAGGVHQLLGAGNNEDQNQKDSPDDKDSVHLMPSLLQISGVDRLIGGGWIQAWISPALPVAVVAMRP